MDYYKLFDYKLGKQDKKRLNKHCLKEIGKRKYNIMSRKKIMAKEIKSTKHFGMYLQNLVAIDYNEYALDRLNYTPPSNIIDLDYWHEFSAHMCFFDICNCGKCGYCLVTSDVFIDICIAKDRFLNKIRCALVNKNIQR